MLYDTEPPRDPDAVDKSSRRHPRSALEAELNTALDRLDHQVKDTRDYLAALDKQTPPARRRRRATDRKPDGSEL